jgi:ketosteroid isomerase-like protein
VKQLKAGAIASAIVVVLSIMASGTPARADARADIKALEQRFGAAVQAKDVDAIMQVYAPGPALLVFDVIPPRQYVGAAAYRKDWQGFLDGFAGPIAVELANLDIGVDRNLAYSHSIQRVSGTDKQGKKIDLTVRVTDVYQKIHGRWLIIHEHVSVPVDLATDKPDLAAKP